ncbi:MAG: TIGR02300 family protein [Pseudomonadota bacterium]
MPKPEWGTKRTCPQTGERFYDLGNDNPVTSPNGHQWYPEPVLKSKQPIPIDDPAKAKTQEADADLSGDEEDDDLKDIENIDDEDDSPDNDVDLGGDDDLGVAAGKGDDDGEDDN